MVNRCQMFLNIFKTFLNILNTFEYFQAESDIVKGPIRFCRFVRKTELLFWDLHLKENLWCRLKNYMGSLAATEYIGILSLWLMLYLKSYSNSINFIFLALHSGRLHIWEKGWAHQISSVDIKGEIHCGGGDV